MLKFSVMVSIFGLHRVITRNIPAMLQFYPNFSQSDIIIGLAAMLNYKIK